ncbi:MAG: restriction endonuclease [Candidatus Bathyarchaeota archaeon]|nr:restriction endonuclease [Candidatus Bathyarchaeota archaeon]
MARKTPQATIYLRQLSKPELNKLADKKKVRIPASWSKGKIVETLATIVSANDVTAFISKPTGAKTKEAQGYARALKGKSLEDRVVQIFSKKGFQCDKNIRLAGMEIDVFGWKKGGWLSEDEYIIAECKNKAKVIPEDFKKFVGNMNLFINKRGLNKDHVQGYLITTGIFDKDTKSQARGFPKIQLKRVKA